jgi:hypothetical protein
MGARCHGGLRRSVFDPRTELLAAGSCEGDRNGAESRVNRCGTQNSI